ncbi:MAG: hypothetical protein H7831_18355 [Magnetococcus sp. WYHC-3]
MNHKISDWAGSIVRATDGDVGTIEQFYFDDLTWIVRYMTVNTEELLPDRQVLVSLAALGKPDWKKRVFPVNLTMAQVRSSPKTNIAKPVSRQHEIKLHAYYAWPVYWGGGFYLPLGYAKNTEPFDEAETSAQMPSSGVRKLDQHLRSTREVADFQVHATDGNIGHVEDCLVDDGTWTIRYFVVNTRNWLPGRRVLVSPQWFRKIEWAENNVFVNLTREAVKKSPAFDPSKPVSIGYEDKLLAHLQKPEVADWVVFKFNAPSGAEVYVAGTFNNWNATTIHLGDNHKGTYTATVLLPPGRHEYKFIVNGEWHNGPDCQAQVPNVFGTTNSVLFVGRTATHAVHLHTFARQPHTDDRPAWGTPTS